MLIISPNVRHSASIHARLTPTHLGLDSFSNLRRFAVRNAISIFTHFVGSSLMRALWLHSHIATLTIPATGLQSLRRREFAAKLSICVPDCGRFGSRVTCGGLVDMDEGGLDSEGKTYASRNEMWEAEAGEDVIGNPKNVDKKRDWYHKGVSYWEGVEASVDGVLGGYGNVSSRDVVDSKAFILEMFSEIPPRDPTNLVALDCGAGVGRVTKNFLLQHFHEVDLVEPVRHFLEKAQGDLGTTMSGHKAVNFYCTPLQEFTPEPGRYDVIWVQWCIGHLTDHDFVEFFKRAQVGLKPGGFFVLKENIAKNGFVVDKEDSSVTRSDAYFRDLFKQTGFHLYKTRLQKGFPKDLFAVRMYAVTPEPVSATPAANQVRTRRHANQPRKIV